MLAGRSTGCPWQPRHDLVFLWDVGMTQIWALEVKPRSLANLTNHRRSSNYLEYFRVVDLAVRSFFLFNIFFHKTNHVVSIATAAGLLKIANGIQLDLFHVDTLKSELRAVWGVPSWEYRILFQIFQIRLKRQRRGGSMSHHTCVINCGSLKETKHLSYQPPGVDSITCPWLWLQLECEIRSHGWPSAWLSPGEPSCVWWRVLLRHRMGASLSAILSAIHRHCSYAGWNGTFVFFSPIVSKPSCNSHYEAPAKCVWGDVSLWYNLCMCVGGCGVGWGGCTGSTRWQKVCVHF